MKKLKSLIFLVVFCNFILTTVACQTKEERVNSIVQECQAFLDKDDLQGASACYQKTIITNPANAKEISTEGQKAVFKKCLEFKDRKELELSIICLEGLAELSPESSVVFLQLGDSYYVYYQQQLKLLRKKDFELLNKAEEALKRSIEINPEKAIARETYGEILKAKEDWEGSLREHSYAVELEPTNTRMLIELGFVQEKTDNDEKAVESYRKVLEIEPDDQLTLYLIGKVYEKIGKTDEAIDAYEKLVKIRSDYDDAGQRLKALKEKRDREKPEKAKTKAVGN